MAYINTILGGMMIDATFEMLLLVSGVGCFVAAGYLWRRAWGAVRRAVGTATTDTVAINTIAPETDIVAVEGTAVPSSTTNLETEILAAPFSGTDCLAYTYSVQEKKELSNSDLPRSADSAWVIRDQGRDAVTFAVDDGTDQILVQPDGAELQFEADTYEHFPWRTLPDPIEGYLESSPAVERQDAVLTSIPLVGHLVTWLTWTDRRFVEKRLEPQDEVYIQGALRPDSQTAFGDDRVAITEPRRGASLVISDTGTQGTQWRVSKTVLYFGGYGLVVFLTGVFFVGLFLDNIGVTVF